MEKLSVSLEEANGSRLDARSKNFTHIKELRQSAESDETRQKLLQDPYLEIWEIDFLSSSDEEDDNSEQDVQSSSDDESEVDSSEDEKEKEEESEALD